MKNRKKVYLQQKDLCCCWRAQAAESGDASTLQTSGMAGSLNSTPARYSASFSAASAISGLWKAPDVARRAKRLPSAAHASSARATASGVPEMTI